MEMSTLREKRIIFVGTVPRVEEVRKDFKVRVIDGRGRTLMSGLGDAHTHLTWNNGAADALGDVGVEEPPLITARSTQCDLDSMCFGRRISQRPIGLDCVIRDPINSGAEKIISTQGTFQDPDIWPMEKKRWPFETEREIVAGITTFADGPLEMREVIRNLAYIQH